MPLFGAARKRRCFYCNQSTRLEAQAGPVRQFECNNCLAVNHLDQHGNITDPPVQVTASRALHAPPRFGRDPRSSSTSPPRPAFSFCAECQKNQHFLASAKANLDPPDERSPTYPQYLEELAKLERRYPVICNKCRPRAREQIVESAYDAKARNMLVIMQNTRNRMPSARQQWKHFARDWFLWLGGFGWLVSILAQFLWHVLGACASDFESSELLHDPLSILRDFSLGFDWSTLAASAKSGIIDPRVFGLVTPFLPLILALDILTIWWNPRLRKKFMRSGRGRMIGSRDFYTMRSVILVLRYAGAYCLQSPNALALDMKQFNYAHGSLAIVIALLSLRSLPMVRLSTKPLVDYHRFREKDVLPDPDPRLMQEEHRREELARLKQEQPRLTTGMLSARSDAPSSKDSGPLRSHWPTAYASQQPVDTVPPRARQMQLPLTPPEEPDNMEVDPYESPTDDVFRLSKSLRGWLPPTPTLPKAPTTRTQTLRSRKPANTRAPPATGWREYRRPSIISELDDMTNDGQSTTTEVPNDNDEDDLIHAQAKPGKNGRRGPEMQLAPTKLWLDKDYADTGLEDMFASVLGGTSFSEDDNDDHASTPATRPTNTAALAQQRPAAAARLGTWLGAAAMLLFPLAVLAGCAFAVKSLR